MYKIGDRYLTKKGRTYFFILNPGNAEGKFVEAIQTYGNALINTTGGIIVFGVDEKGYVRGFELTRQSEDNYKCCFDRSVRNFRPTIHPHQYRMDVLYLNYYKAIFEIRISAGDVTEIYENPKKEMFVVKEKALYGPLFPCEIAQIVLEKYKEEIAMLMVGKNPSPENESTSTGTKSSTAKEEVKQEPEQQEQTAKRARITWP